MGAAVEIAAPIVAVTVHQGRARITRRGAVDVPAGASEVVLADLPATLVEDSIRVAGRGAEARIVGVDVRSRDLAEVPDPRVRAAEDALRAAERVLAAVDADDAGAVARETLLARLADRGGARLAAALAEGTATLDRIGELGESVAAEVVAVAALRRGVAERRVSAQHAVDAARAELDRSWTSGRHRREVVVGVEVDAAGGLELDVVYQVERANWTSAYDARLTAAGTVSLTCFGVVRQASGEDWPAVELTLSTAQPATTAHVPELDPWWVGPVPPAVPSWGQEQMGNGPQGYGGMSEAAPPPGGVQQQRVAAPAAVMKAEPVLQTSEHAVAAQWRLPRPTAVPGDAAAHRTTVTTVELPVRLDHVLAPAVSTDAHLRASVTNASGHALLAGPVSCFLDDAFVGSSTIDATAPDGELELALGVDDRVVVERELDARTARKARFGTHRATVERWTTTVTNRRANAVHLVVRDRVPVARTADVKIVDVALEPTPAEQDDLGRIEWTATVEPGGTWTATTRFGVDAPRELRLDGWA